MDVVKLKAKDDNVAALTVAFVRNALLPRALPWAGRYCAFSAYFVLETVTGEKAIVE